MQRIGITGLVITAVTAIGWLIKKYIEDNKKVEDKKEIVVNNSVRSNLSARSARSDRTDGSV